jgi:hypothetical protein
VATVKWEDLKTRVRRRADQASIQPTKAFVTTDELNERANESFSAFHDLVLELQKHEWSLVQPVHLDIALSSSTTTYALPPELMAVKAVRISDGTWSEPVRPYEHDERAYYEGVDAGWRDAMRWNYVYRVEGRNIMLRPEPSGSVDTLSVDYVPEWRELQDGMTVECPYGWWLWPVLHCAIGCVHKRFPGEPAQSLMAEWQAEDRRIRALAGRRVPRPLKISAVRDDVDDDDYGRMWPS